MRYIVEMPKSETEWENIFRDNRSFQTEDEAKKEESDISNSAYWTKITAHEDECNCGKCSLPENVINLR